MAAQRLGQEIPRTGGSEIRALFRDLKRAGCRWAQARSGHWKVYDPSGRWVGTVGRDLGNRHNLENFRHDIGKAGVII